MNSLLSLTRPLNIVKRMIGNIANNQHQNVFKVINGENVQTDDFLEGYEDAMIAFIVKRWITKKEIPAKICTIKIKQNQLAHTNYQKLTNIEMKNESELKLKHDNKQIDQEYLISKFCEPHFKQMMDQYLEKVLVCGFQPRMIDFTYQKIARNAAVDYYNTFIYGEQLTPFEQDLEYNYLSFKKQKFIHNFNIKLFSKIDFTQSNQKLLDQIENHHSQLVDLFEDSQIIYQKLELHRKAQNILQRSAINNRNPILKAFIYFTQYLKVNRLKYQVEIAAQTMITRAFQQIDNKEFQKELYIPDDWNMEQQFTNLHIWMIIDRLKKINTPVSQHMVKIMELIWKKHLENNINQINIRRKNDFARDVYYFMDLGRNQFEYHFNRNPQTIRNNYLHFDALVWTIQYFEKIPRHSSEIYKMAEYFIQTFKYIQTLSFEDYMDANIFLDVQRVSWNATWNILQNNNLIDEQTFIREFTSDQPKKSYYYSSLMHTQQPENQNSQLLHQIEKQKNYDLQIQDLCSQPNKL